MEKHVNFEGSNLNNQQKEKVQEMLMRNQQRFSRIPNDLRKYDKIKHKIILNKRTQPFWRNFCRMKFDIRKAMKNFVEDLEDAKLIEPTDSYLTALLIWVKKKDRSYRLVVGYGVLTKQIKKTSRRLPIRDDVIDRLGGYYYFFNIDLTSRIFQMALDEGSQNLRAFVTPLGLYQWKRLPMGLAPATGIFQNLLELNMGTLLWNSFSVPGWHNHLR